MKVAIVLSGHLRSYKDTLQNFNDFVNKIKSDNHEVKIFCHTWSEVESNTTSWWKQNEIKESALQSIENEVINKYDPAAYIVENSENVILENEFEFYKSRISFEGVQLMYYSLSQSFEILKEFELKNNWQSDLVIRSRYDILLDFENIPLSPSNIMIPISGAFDIIGGLSDVFAMIPRNQIDFYAEQYKNFCDKSILKKYFERYTLFIPELFLATTMHRLNYFPINNNITILRLNGDEIMINVFYKTPIINDYFYKIKLDNEKKSFEETISYYFQVVYPKRISKTNNKELKLFVDSLLLRFSVTLIFKSFNKKNNFIESNIKYGIEYSQSILKKTIFRILIKIF